GTLIRTELQQPRERFQHLHRDPDIAALLQPGVPGHAHADQFCHLLAPQPRCPPPGPSGQAELCWEDTSSMRSEEVGEFRPPLRLRRIPLCHTAILRVTWYWLILG